MGCADLAEDGAGEKLDIKKGPGGSGDGCVDLADLGTCGVRRDVNGEKMMGT